MSVFTVGAYPCTAITTLATTASGLTVQFSWDQQLPTEKIQVYKGTTTTQGDSVFLAATYDHNFQDALNASSGTVYYWLRKINDVGGVGPWSSMITATVTAASGGSVTIGDGSITPAKLSSGFAIDPATGNLKASTVGISQLATTSVSSISPSISGSTSSGSVSSYNTWQSFGSATFTATAKAYYAIYLYLALQFSGITWDAASNQIQVITRFRLHDNTSGADVPAMAPQQMMYYAVDFLGGGGGVSTYVNKTFAEYTMNIVEGFRNQLIAGHSYTVFMEVQKTRTTTNQAITVQVNACNSSATGGSFS